MKVYVVIAEYTNVKDFSVLGAFLSAKEASMAIRDDKLSSFSRFSELFYEIVETQLDLLA